ncbi:MAG: FtsK/SpoIIIE domain-containing protein [Streptosporangiales bacterium]|nr:FtsK/SpoIIIE domain-containing protein [Streptosporangiales bacterium]
MAATRTRRPAPPKPAPKRPAPARRRNDLVTTLATKTAVSTYRATAVGAGTLARAARTPDIDPEQRRDSAGLTALIAAAALAGLTWWPVTAEPLGSLRFLAQDLGGGLAWILPVIAAIVSWRLFRHPHRSQRTGQHLSGTALAYTGALGLDAVFSGLPSLAGPAGLAAVRPAGGIPGWLLTELPAAYTGLLAPWLAGLLSVATLAGGIRLMLGVPFRDALSTLAVPAGTGWTRLPARDASAAGDVIDWPDLEEEGDDDPRSWTADSDPAPEEAPEISPVDAAPYAAPGGTGTRNPENPGDVTAGDVTGPAGDAPGTDDGEENGQEEKEAPQLVSFLGHGSAHQARTRENDAMLANLQETLAQYSVDAKVTGYVRGPAITQYELVPGTGVKVKKVTELAPEFRLSAKTQLVRVLPVIEGKSAIGVEIPNARREVVSLGDVLRSPEASGNPGKLLLGLGKDIEGRAITGDLSQLLHILVAGATGGGKSGVLNDLIVSLLTRNSPDDLQMLMIDPKQVEFAMYRGLPHLWTPIVTDAEEAASSLEAVCAEMDRRYSLMAAHGCKNIDTFNANVRKGKIKGPGIGPLPRLAVFIDELADLIAENKDDVEKAIKRITQVGRAAGIHLIAATQRPSTDVITGVIKANIPTKIALMTANHTDSQVIIGQPGAEALTGQGDALFVPNGTSRPLRIQAGWVTDSEIQAIVRHWISEARQHAGVPVPA